MALQGFSGEEKIVRLMNLTARSADPSIADSAVTSLSGDDEIQFSVVNATTLAIVSTVAGSNNSADDWWAVLTMPTVTEKTLYRLQAKAYISSREQYWETDIWVEPVANPDA